MKNIYLLFCLFLLWAAEVAAQTPYFQGKLIVPGSPFAIFYIDGNMANSRLIHKQPPL